MAKGLKVLVLRTKYVWITLASLALLALVVLLEIDQDVAPNPLMILNTACLVILSLLLFGVTWWCPKKTGQLVFAFSMIFFCSLGLLFSIRHVLLQYFYPPAVPLCLSSEFSTAMLLSFQQWVLFLRDAWMSGVNCPNGQVVLLDIPLHFICLGWYSLIFIFVCFQVCEVIEKAGPSY